MAARLIQIKSSPHAVPQDTINRGKGNAKGPAMTRPIRTAALSGLLALAACTAPAPPGAELYATLCAGCHGATGTGDGTISAELPVAPVNLTRLRADNGGMFPRDATLAWIHGYPDRYSTRVMPEFGPLLDGPTELVMTDDGRAVPTSRALILIVDYLETLQEE
jgi:mono/diheme cytochrome c family protein